MVYLTSYINYLNYISNHNFDNGHLLLIYNLDKVVEELDLLNVKYKIEKTNLVIIEMNKYISYKPINFDMNKYYWKQTSVCII